MLCSHDWSHRYVSRFTIHYYYYYLIAVFRLDFGPPSWSSSSHCHVIRFTGLVVITLTATLHRYIRAHFIVRHDCLGDTAAPGMVDHYRCSTGPAWKDAVGRLRQIERDDRAFVRAAPNTDRNLVRAATARLYVRYIMIILYCAYYYYYYDVLLCPDSITLYSAKW